MTHHSLNIGATLENSKFPQFDLKVGQSLTLLLAFVWSIARPAMALTLDTRLRQGLKAPKRAHGSEYGALENDLLVVVEHGKPTGRIVPLDQDAMPGGAETKSLH